MSNINKIKIAYLIVLFGILGFGLVGVVRAANEVTLTLSSSSGSPGGTAVLNVSIDTSQVLTNVSGVQWDFIYNSSDISSVSVSDGSAATSAGKNASCATISAGDYRCLVVGFNQNTILSGVLSVATFTLSNSTSASSIPIQFSGLVATDSNANSVGILANGASISVNQSAPPPTTPSIPTNLSATTISSNQINLSWTTSTGAVGYKIFRGGSQIGTSATNSYSDSGLSPSTQYIYSVSAYNSSGESSQSSSASAVTQVSAPTTPSIPTNLSATAVSTSQINLSWTTSTGATGYKIFRSGSQIGTSATNSYSNTGLSASTQYTYTVSAYNSSGGESSQSSSASAVTQSVSVPPPPSGGGGGGGGGGTSTPDPTIPIINSFTANPSGITKGQSSVLSWNILNITGASIDNGIGQLHSQSMSVSPTKTTEYTLTATKDSKSITAKVTIIVDGLPLNSNTTTSTNTTNTTTTTNNGTTDDETITKLKAMIAELLKQVATLQAQLQAKLNGTTYVAGTGFTRDLTVGSKGEDVRALQVFLNTHGFPVTTTGEGSTGKETTYFGQSTRNALIKYQISQSIYPSSGYFGPITRGRVGK